MWVLTSIFLPWSVDRLPASHRPRGCFELAHAEVQLRALAHSESSTLRARSRQPRAPHRRPSWRRPSPVPSRRPRPLRSRSRELSAGCKVSYVDPTQVARIRAKKMSRMLPHTRHARMEGSFFARYCSISLCRKPRRHLGPQDMPAVRDQLVSTLSEQSVPCTPAVLTLCRRADRPAALLRRQSATDVAYHQPPAPHGWALRCCS